MAGDYNKYRMAHADRSVDRTVLAATDYTTANALITVRNSSHTLYIQRIVVNVTTYAAKIWTFQDNAGTPVSIGKVTIGAAAPATEGDQTVTIEFGPVGVALTAGKNLMMLMDATGAAGQVHVEAYERLTPNTAVALSTTL